MKVGAVNKWRGVFVGGGLLEGSTCRRRRLSPDFGKRG